MRLRPRAAGAPRVPAIIFLAKYNCGCSIQRGVHDGLASFRRSARVFRAKIRVLPAALLLSMVLGIGYIGSSRAADGYYTKAQATAGEAVFDQTCSVCHGDHLQGKAGPALSGEQFLSVSQFQKLTADYLYRFMSKQMPANAPGSLSKSQYLDVLAYILQVNGYPAGSQQLTANDQKLARIKIEPTGQSQGGSDVAATEKTQ